MTGDELFLDEGERPPPRTAAGAGRRMGGWADERAKTAKSVRETTVLSYSSKLQSIFEVAYIQFERYLFFLFFQVRIQSAVQIAPPSAYGMGDSDEEDAAIPIIPDLDDVQDEDMALQVTTMERSFMVLFETCCWKSLNQTIIEVIRDNILHY
jgi:hypothetical protein